MTAQTAAVNRVHKPSQERSLKVAASTTIYKGGLIMVLVGTGFAIPAADTALGKIFGIALETVDNSAGSDGDLRVKVMKTGVWRLVLTGVTDADVGQYVFASDDQTVVKSGQSNDVAAGLVVGVYATNTAWVDIEDRRKEPDQQAHIADPAACAGMTGSDPTACVSMTLSAYTAPTDLTEPPTKGEVEAELALIDAALDEAIVDVGALKTAIDANNVEIDALVVDVTALKVAIDINNGLIDSILAALETAGLLATS